MFSPSSRIEASESNRSWGRNGEFSDYAAWSVVAYGPLPQPYQGRLYGVAATFSFNRDRVPAPRVWERVTVWLELPTRAPLRVAAKRRTKEADRVQVGTVHTGIELAD